METFSSFVSRSSYNLFAMKDLGKKRRHGDTLGSSSHKSHREGASTTPEVAGREAEGFQKYLGGGGGGATVEAMKATSVFDPLSLLDFTLISRKMYRKIK